jgi:hypothetical protein
MPEVSACDFALYGTEHVRSRSSAVVVAGMVSARMWLRDDGSVVPVSNLVTSVGYEMSCSSTLPVSVVTDVCG